MKTLVLYVFHVYNSRVQYFFKNAIFSSNEVDFLIICNSLDVCDSVFPSGENIKVLKRENYGYDFGGWSYGLLKDNLYKDYTHFIFVNSSVIGPFLPKYYKGNWTDVYLDGLKDGIRLFGSTINCAEEGVLNVVKNSHVQSYIFSMDLECLQMLIEEGIFTLSENESVSFLDTVLNKEIGMSRKVLKHGWNIGCLYTYYDGVDFTFRVKRPEEYNKTFLGDIMQHHYYNNWWTLYELVFVKGNRVHLF
jgi:hypothetical protein